MSGASLIVVLAWLAGGDPRIGVPGGEAWPESRRPAATASSYPDLLRAATAGWNADGISALRGALAARAAGRMGDAATGFSRAASLLPGLADWAQLFAADVAGRSGDTARVRLAFEALDPYLAVERGATVLAAARSSAGDGPGAIRALNPALASTDADRRSGALFRLGELQLRARDSARAIASFRSAIETAPLSASALAAGRLMGAIPTLAPADQAIVGRLFLRHGNFDRAITHLDRSLRRAPASDTAAVRLEISRALVNARRDAEAENRIARIRTKTVPPAIADEATVLLARIRIRQGRAADAKTLLASIERPHPGAATGLYLLADLEHDRNQIATASALYRRIMTEYPTSSEAFEAAMRLGALAFTSGRFQEAAAVYEDAASKPHEAAGTQRALFWAGRSRAAASDTTRARAHFTAAWNTDPTTFYGLRAGETVGLRLRAALGPSPATTEVTTIEATGAGARIALLLELGLTDDAAFERERARRHFDTRGAGLYAVAEALHERGRTVDAVRLGREIRRGIPAWDERLLRIVYPLPHGERIIRAARDRGLDPFLVAGLIRQESLFDTRAKSVAGAIGLMQVMPRTGRDLARRDGLTGFATEKLNDPDINLRLGTLFFVNLLDQHGGAVAYALAAYNAGPSRVARWKQQPDMTDPDLFAERIPFAETRDYVRIVQQNARIYAEIYGELDGR